MGEETGRLRGLTRNCGVFCLLVAYSKLAESGRAGHSKELRVRGYSGDPKVKEVGELKEPV